MIPKGWLVDISNALTEAQMYIKGTGYPFTKRQYRKINKALRFIERALRLVYKLIEESEK